MYKTGLIGLTLILLGSSLSGCQFIASPEAKVQPRLSSDKIELLESPMPKGLVSLHCTGDIRCEFGKLNNIVVIDELTKQPTNEAINAALVRLESMKPVGPQLASKYFVAMQPKSNEIKVRFYPITPERAENFSLIHNFKAGKTYQLNMFRKQGNTGSSSLLSMATPDPLCVQLLEDDKISRLFCRPFDPATGLGEFIEQRVTSS